MPIKTPANPISTELSVHAAVAAANIASTAAFDSCRAVSVNADGNYKLYFTDAPTTGVTVYLLAGIVYPFSIMKATTTADGALSAGVLNVYY